jgi:hypothetical protein
MLRGPIDPNVHLQGVLHQHQGCDDREHAGQHDRDASLCRFALDELASSAPPASTKDSAVLITIGVKLGSTCTRAGRRNHQPANTVPP